MADIWTGLFAFNFNSKFWHRSDSNFFFKPRD